MQLYICVNWKVKVNNDEEIAYSERKPDSKYKLEGNIS